jgi:hypothetical protein
MQLFFVHEFHQMKSCFKVFFNGKAVLSRTLIATQIRGIREIRGPQIKNGVAIYN